MLAKECKKSLNQIEKELGYPRNALHNYKNSSEPSGYRLLELAEYFGVSPYYLIGKEKNLKDAKNVELCFDKLSLKQKKELYIACETWFISLLK